jgi:hypothetical protein
LCGRLLILPQTDLTLAQYSIAVANTWEYKTVFTLQAIQLEHGFQTMALESLFALL